MNGIRFRTWLYFTLFALGIIAVLWVLQISSLNPYFRSVKESSIRNIMQNIVGELKAGNYNTDYFDEIARMNNLCFSIYDVEENLITLHDGIGIGCYLNNNRIPPEEQFQSSVYFTEINQNVNHSVITYVNVTGQDYDMVVYGSKVFVHLSGYYLFVNSVVEPVGDSVFIIQNQFILLSAVVILLSAGMSLLISQRMAKPIIEMKKNASKLGEGDYSVDFATSQPGYDEINELAYTLNFATEQLSKTDELRKDLVANVSHDIKTPLTMIKAYAEMIYDISGDVKEKREEHLKVIINETNHLDRLVTDMLELSKMQSGALELTMTKTDINELAHSIIDLFEFDKESKKLKILLEGIPESFVYIDSVKIGQVLFNFINNAIKFMGKDHKVIVRITDLESVYRVEIIDHGAGIAQEELDSIWDRYYRINKHHARNREGTGLGLSIAKAILEAHHMYFGVESEVGKGSTFFFDALKYKE